MVDKRSTPSSGSKRQASTGRPNAAEEPVLPYARAFVVQFTGDTDPGLAYPVGRVEHLQTGRRWRFASVDELLSCIAGLLAGQATSGSAGSKRATKK